MTITGKGFSRRILIAGGLVTLLSGVMGITPGAAGGAEPAKLDMKSNVRRVAANGLTFDVVITGPEDGRAILLLHGFPQAAWVWTEISHELNRQGFRTIAPDLRGVSPGARPTDINAYKIKNYMADVLAIADALGLDRFDLCGFGMGGALSWMIAAETPHRVRSLTALRFPHPAAFAKGVKEDPEQQVAWRKIADTINSSTVESIETEAVVQLADNATKLRAFLSDSGMPPAFMEKYISRLKEPGMLVGEYFFHHALSLDEFAHVPRVTVSTYFVWSEGPALTKNTTLATADFVDGKYRLVFLSNATHFLIESAPDEVLALLLEHLRETK